MNQLPESLGPYRIESLLGRGAMGAVFRGRHERLGVLRAVKLLTGRMTPHRVERFAREAQALARLNHPSVVAIHDVGQTDAGELYYAMDMIEGQPLDEVLIDREFTYGEALSLAVAIARSVEILHQAGLVHRDLKPGNVMSRPDGTPVVLDLGLAFALDSDSRLTKTGALLGTPLYMAPEQGGGSDRPTPAADVFSLGLLALELTSGVGITELDALPAFAAPPLASELNPALPLALDKVLARATDRKADLRYQTAGELADALEALGGGGLSRRAWRRLMVVGGGVLVLVCLAGAAHFLTGPVDHSSVLAGGSSPPAVASPSPELDLSVQAERLVGELRREKSAKKRHVRALEWLERHPRGVGRESVLAAAEAASLELELLRLPGVPSSVRHISGAFAGSGDVFGIWNRSHLAHWSLDTSDPHRPRATKVSARPVESGAFASAIFSDPGRRAVVHHARKGIRWLGAPGVVDLPAAISLPPAPPDDLDFDPDHERIVVCRGQEVLVVPTEGGRPTLLCRRGAGVPRRARFSADGAQIVVAWEAIKRTRDDVSRYWVDAYQAETGKRLERWALVSQPNALHRLPGGRFVSGNSDGQLTVMVPGVPVLRVPFLRRDLATHRHLSHAMRVMALERLGRDPWILSGAQSRDRRSQSEIALWRLDGTFIRSAFVDGVLVQLSISPDRKWFLVSGRHGFGLMRLKIPDLEKH
ncbi:MAG: serine/threonine protein kinase [Planctomycetes bacterium]|nr:serine/threonine protein kinase [Planctomycetota bacterium]